MMKRTRSLMGVGIAAATLAVLATSCSKKSEPVQTSQSQSEAVDSVAEPTGDPYSLTIKVSSESGTLGALQFDVQYTGSKGGFVGTADKVECESLIERALSAFTNKGGTKMTGALVSVNGFSTPQDVARCRFRSPQPVSPGSFTITVTDASDTDTMAVTPAPEMLVSEAKPAS